MSVVARPRLGSIRYGTGCGTYVRQNTGAAGGRETAAAQRRVVQRQVQRHSTWPVPNTAGRAARLYVGSWLDTRLIKTERVSGWLVRGDGGRVAGRPAVTDGGRCSRD